MTNLIVEIDEFEFQGRLYGGELTINYSYDRADQSYDWDVEMLRLVDITDGDADWTDDDVRSTIPADSSIAKALFSNWNQHIIDCCADAQRWV